MKSFTFRALIAAACVYVVTGHPIEHNSTVGNRAVQANAPPNCFPAVGFKMPSSVPSSLNNWWCDYSTEYAFVGFSYEISACQSVDTLRRDFTDIRSRFKGRYVRLYGVCESNPNHYNNVIEAAWSAGIGVHALIWFGFDGTDIYKSRRDALFNILKTNSKAKFVTRVVQFGSEPLYDWAIYPGDLANEVKAAKAALSGVGIPITVSEMAYGYQLQKDDGSMDVLKAEDFVDAHMLPFFSQQASTANVQNEQDYYDLLDSHCGDFKSMKGGGVGWFAHIYSDNQEPGYGIYGTNGQLKIRFSPKTSC
ncbi:hypothetical protein H1R20_g2402, partial [Candolleomyces eurysporus]